MEEVKIRATQLIVIWRRYYLLMEGGNSISLEIPFLCGLERELLLQTWLQLHSKFKGKQTSS